MKTKNTNKTMAQAFGLFVFAMLMVSNFSFALTMPVNKAPVISGAGGPTNINVNEQGTWSITATDPENGPLVYNVIWGDENFKAPTLPTVQSLSNGQKATFQHTYYDAGTYTIKFTVADSLGATTESTITVNVNGAGTVDLAVSKIDISVSTSPTNNGRGVTYSTLVTNKGSAASGGYDTASYLDGKPSVSGVGYPSLPPGGSMTDVSGTLEVSPGWHTFKYVIKPYGADSNSANNVMEKSFYVEPLPSGNKAPVITSTGGPTSIKVGEQGTWSVKAYDPEGKSLFYAVSWGDEDYKQPSANPIQSVATFQHIYYTAGYYTITITVQDDQGATTQTTITANVGSAPQPVNQPPQVTYIYGPFWNNGPSSLKVGETGKWRVEGSDPEDGSMVTIKMDFGDGTAPQTLSYTPVTFEHAYSQAGQYKMTITAIDSKGASSSIWGYVYPSGTTPAPTPGSSASVDVSQRLWYAVDGGDAPISVVEFTEFGEPFSQRAQATMQQIENNYGRKVNFIHINFPITSFIHPISQKAAEAVECAGAQGAYWPMHDRIFSDKPSDVSGLKSIASSIGINTAAFNSCLDSGEMVFLVESQKNIGTNLGFQGVPTFVIGYRSGNTVYGEVLEGAQPYENFAAAIARVRQVQVNRAPVISGTGGPTNVNTGETGTWKISAYDPENGALSYSVKWGDEDQLKVVKPELISENQAGTYTITFTVTDDSGQQTQSTLSVNVGSGKYSVDVGAYAEPSQVKVGDSFKVIGKITYNSGPSNGEQKFKVVTKYSGSEYGVAPKIQVKLASLEDDVVSILNQYFYVKPSAKPIAEPEKASAPTSASGGATAVAEAIEDKVASELGRVDYVVLRPGESTSVSAYFAAKSAGTKYVTVSVYKEMPYMCVAAPCPSEWKLVGQSTTKVSVVGSEQPPSPPSEGTIKLYKGWNMVSVPVGSTVSMKEVSAECNSKPYAWKLTSTGYVKEYTLYPGVGYWIKSSGECEFDVSESTTIGQLFAVPELFPGWNLIAAPTSAVSISDYAGTCSISQGPWYYSHELGKPKPEYVYSSTLEPARAYWVNVPSACTLGGSEQPPAPPPS